MNTLKTLNCIFCLVRCSKYLYFLKKIICVAAVVLTVVLALTAFSQRAELMKGFGVK